MNIRRKYSNDEITVFWRPSECVHATICFTRLFKVFNPRRRPWIILEGAENEEIIDVVNACPTRALTFMWNDPEKNAQETSPKAEKSMDAVGKDFISHMQEQNVTEVKIMQNGPIVVSGNFQLVSPKGETLTPDKPVSLCRCGYSKNQPYCDGSHVEYGFKEKK